MKKTFKKLIATAMLAVSVVSATMMVGAKSSDWIESPGYLVGTWKSTYDKRANVTTDQESITADRIEFKIKGFRQLTTDFSNATRTMEIKVYDDDVDNADDLVKKYKGTIYNRTLVYVMEDTTCRLDGSIDASGDNQAELYIDFYIPKEKNDPTEPWLYSGWFKYMFEAKSYN